MMTMRALYVVAACAALCMLPETGENNPEYRRSDRALLIGTDRCASVFSLMFGRLVV